MFSILLDYFSIRPRTPPLNRTTFLEVLPGSSLHSLFSCSFGYPTLMPLPPRLRLPHKGWGPSLSKTPLPFPPPDALRGPYQYSLYWTAGPRFPPLPLTRPRVAVTGVPTSPFFFAWFEDIYPSLTKSPGPIPPFPPHQSLQKPLVSAFPANMIFIVPSDPAGSYLAFADPPVF